MIILITGSGTLVGNTISKFLAKKYKVIASFNKNRPINFEKDKNIKVVKIDITKKINMKKKFDALVHCASIVPEKGIKKHLFNKVNYLGFKKLLKLAKKNNCKKIVLLSTMSVYGKITKKKITENESFNKPDAYGLSKIKMEKELKDYCIKNGAEAVIFRLPGLLGFKSQHNFLSNALSIIKENKEITINNPNLKYNNIVHVRNLAEIVKQSLEQKIKFKIYNLGCKNPMRFQNIFELMFERLRIKKKIRINKKNGGFSINLNKNLKKNFSLYTTKQAVHRFISENINSI